LILKIEVREAVVVRLQRQVVVGAIDIVRHCVAPVELSTVIEGVYLFDHR
jgi:hypothetical protein